MSVPAALAAALAAAADVSALVTLPRNGDVVLLALALAGLIVGHRLSPRRALRRWTDDQA